MNQITNMTPEDQKNTSSVILIEHRCNCGKLLFKGLIASSELEIKCRNCHAINVVGKDPESLSHDSHYSILFNLNAHIIDASDSAIKILGYPKEKLASMRIQDIYPLLKLSTYTHLASISHFLDIEPFSWDTLCQNSQGKFVLVKVKVRYLQDRHGATLAMFDCIQRTENLVSDLPMENLSNQHCKFISRINSDNKYTYVSTKLATLLNCPSIEILGKSLFDFFPKNNKEKLQQIFQNPTLKESFTLIPHTMIGKNKNTLNFESYFAAEVNDKGQLRGFQIMSNLIH